MKNEGAFSLRARLDTRNHDRGALYGAERGLPPRQIIRCECLGMIMRSKHLTKLEREGGDGRERAKGLLGGVGERGGER